MGGNQPVDIIGARLCAPVLLPSQLPLSSTTDSTMPLEEQLKGEEWSQGFTEFSRGGVIKSIGV